MTNGTNVNIKDGPKGILNFLKAENELGNYQDHRVMKKPGSMNVHPTLRTTAGCLGERFIGPLFLAVERKVL